MRAARIAWRQTNEAMKDALTLRLIFLDQAGATIGSDELGRLMRAIGASSQQTNYGYDRTDNLVSITDPRSNLYAYAYDALSRLIRETDQEGSQVNLTRDPQDEVVAYSDPRSIVTSYVRNGFGEVIQEASPDAGTTIYVRDARGLVTQMTDGRGIVANYANDNGGRVTSVSYPSSTAENVTYTYDSNTGGNKVQSCQCRPMGATSCSISRSSGGCRSRSVLAQFGPHDPSRSGLPVYF